MKAAKPTAAMAAAWEMEVGGERLCRIILATATALDTTLPIPPVTVGKSRG
jgi:hypothetical protein